MKRFTNHINEKYNQDDIHKIKQIIESFPKEVKTQIYMDCDVSLKLYNQLFDYIIKTDIENIAKLLPRVFANHIVIKYLCKTDKYFKYLYNDYDYIKEEHPNNFEEYFALSWINLWRQ